MTLQVRRYRSDDREAIDRLNARLADGHVTHRVYGEPSIPAGDRVHRVFLATTPPEVHGGVGLVEQSFNVAGSTVRAGWVKYPVAESLVDPSYSGVPGSLMFQLMREQTRLMALGMGGHGGPLARLLAGMRWHGSIVPFFFSPVRPAQVLRRLEYVRSTAARRAILDIAAGTGLGWLASKTATRLRGPFPSGPLRHVEFEEVECFGPWADDIWERHKDDYGFVALRDSAALNAFYPSSYEGLSRLRLRRDGHDIGWAAALRIDLRESDTSKYFGRLAIGVVADGFAAPRHADAAVAAAVAHLKARDVDLIISNQSHPAWQRAMSRQGFFRGPSNFAFYRSPAMERLVADPEVMKRGVLLNRGDCDGPKWV